MADTQVAIVGGGLAGLNAARLLHRAGVDFVVLEARDRPGGRVLSVDANGRPADDGFDLGPSWYWPEIQPGMAEFVAELGLPTFPQFSEGHMTFERAVEEGSIRVPGFHQEAQSMRLVGGSSALVRALMRHIPADRLRFAAAVMAMRMSEDGVELTVVVTGEGRRVVKAGHVIAAVPPRLLEQIVFTPGLDPQTSRLWKETPTWMAPHAKVFAVYDRPFWREAGLSGMGQSLVGPMGEIHDATTKSGRAALFGFVGIPGRQRASIGDDRLVKSCVDQLVRMFGPHAASPRNTIYKDWARDPLTATPLDWTMPGHPVDGVETWVGGPWQERLSLAGSESSPLNAGYLAGAVEASRLAVARLTSKLSSSTAT